MDRDDVDQHWLQFFSVMAKSPSTTASLGMTAASASQG
jgi:hypothetical protein